jgi:hypothetical protein
MILLLINPSRMNLERNLLPERRKTMHSLISAETVETIRSTGNTSKNLPDRIEVLTSYQLPYDRKADNVVVTGCQILGFLPRTLKNLARIMDRGNISYTFLSKEYCCGNNLYRPAIKARDEEALVECRDLSKEFVALNIRKAKELGAKRLVIFCSPCYPIYKYAFPDEDIVFYPQIIQEATPEIDYDGDIDYYPGCYRLHKKFSPAPMDLKSTEAVFKKLKGITINRISAPACCYKPDGLAHMIESVKTKQMVHICTGCYGQAMMNMPADRGVNISMLPDFIEETLSSRSQGSC